MSAYTTVLCQIHKKAALTRHESAPLSVPGERGVECGHEGQGERDEERDGSAHGQHERGHPLPRRRRGGEALGGAVAAVKSHASAQQAQLARA